MSGTVYNGITASNNTFGAAGNIYGGAMSSSTGAATTGRPPQIGRNSIIGPGFNNFDFRISRDVPIHESIKLQFTGEAFNLLNTTNVSARNRTLYNFTGGVLVPQTNLANVRSNFGFDSSTQVNFEDTQRIVQLAAKVTF